MAGAFAEPRFRDRFTPEQWERIAQHGEEVSFEEGEVVMHRGDPAQWLYVVLSGALIVVDPRTTPATVLTRREPGYLFGEVSFTDGGPVSAEVRADEATACLRFGSGSLLAALAEDAELDAVFHQALAATLGWRVRQLTNAAVTGAIAPRRDEVAEAPEPEGIDDPLLGSVLAHQRSGERTVTLAGDRVTLGRDPSCEVVLDDPHVEPRHAELVRTDEGWRVISLAERPLVLDGTGVISGPVADGAEIGLGRTIVRVQGGLATVSTPGPVFALYVEGVGLTAGGKKRLHDVSFTVLAGEVVALVGPSGSGKTTLLNAIAGSAPADVGRVSLDREELEPIVQRMPTLIGEVPQDDIVLPALTVEESFAFAARLRLPKRTAAERAGRVNRVITELGLDSVRRSRIGDPEERGISGGQRKRVNIGSELVAESARLLFLDEPTSGLDPKSAEEIARLARRLADAGRIVFVVTHDLSEDVLEQVDQLLVMAEGGHLAWFGPPSEAVRHFGVTSPPRIFERLLAQSGPEWAQSYATSAARERWVARRTRVAKESLVPTPLPEGGPVGSWMRQWWTLTRRALRVKLRDHTAMTVLAVQPALVGAVTLLVFPRGTASLVFLLTLSAYWFGMSAAVRELIVDRPVWRRERRVGARPSTWVLSKAAVLGAAVTVQCVACAAVATRGVGLDALGFAPAGLAAALVATGWVGVGTGLLVSAIWRRADAAVGTIVLLLVPQIALVGMLTPLDQVHPAAQALSWAMPLRYAFQLALTRGEQLLYVRLGEWFERPISGELFLLGLRPEGEGGMGLPVEWLAGALAAFLVAQLAGAIAIMGLRSRR